MKLVAILSITLKVLSTSVEFATLVAANTYVKSTGPLGNSKKGGTCTCPDGVAYNVSDNNDDCASLQCVGGTPELLCEDNDGNSTEYAGNSGATGMGVVCDLPVYNISLPSCNVDNRGEAAKANITCNFDVTIPKVLNASNFASSIYGSDNCTATDTGLGAAEDVTVVATDLKGNDDDYEVVIQVTPNDTDTIADIKFCLHTELKDDQDNVMIYQSQVFDILFNYTTDFNTTIASSEFDGFNETAADLGTVDFKVDAYKCNSEKQKDESGGGLTINDALYVCIKSNATGIVINEVTEFSLRKEGVEGYKAVEGNDGDFNTFVQNLENDIVLVATRPQAKLFNDNNDIIIEGSVVLGSAAGSRYLARFTQELTGGEVTSSNFEMEVGVVKSVSAANIAQANIFLSFYGAMIGLVIATSVIF